MEDQGLLQQLRELARDIQQLVHQVNAAKQTKLMLAEQIAACNDPDLRGELVQEYNKLDNEISALMQHAHELKDERRTLEKQKR